MTEDAAPRADRWTAQVVTHPDGEVTVDFAPLPFLDVDPVPLAGSTQVWIDPGSPNRPARLEIGDLDESAEVVLRLLGNEGLRAVAAAISAAEPGARAAIAVQSSTEWTAICRWGLVQWLLDRVPSRLDRLLLDIDLATASTVAAQHHLMDSTGLDEVTAAWRRSVPTLIRLAVATSTGVGAREAVHAVSEAVSCAASFTAEHQNRRFSRLPQLDLRLRELSSGLAVTGDIVTTGWSDQVDPAVYEQRIRMALDDLVAELEALGAGVTHLGADRGEPNLPSNDDGVIVGSGTVDWLDVPAHVLDRGENHVIWRWSADTGSLEVTVPADDDAALAGLWRDDLVFRLVDPAGTELASASLAVDAAAGTYGGTARLPDQPPLRSAVQVTLSTSPGRALAESVQDSRRARRFAARATTLTREARLSHTVRGERGIADVDQLLTAAMTEWGHAYDNFRRSGQMDLAELCEQRTLEMQDANLVVLDGAERPTLAELASLGLIHDH